jgi:hypothetical protein
MPIQQRVREPLGYCTEEDIENILLMDINDSFSTQLNNWIVAAEDAVNTYLGYTTASGIWNERIVEEVSETGKIDSTNNLVIFPRKRPINSVEKIELISGTRSIGLSLLNGTRINVDGDTVNNYRYNIPEPKNKIVYPNREVSTEGGSLIIGGFHEIRHQKFMTRLTYTAGYEDIPGPINVATAMLVGEVILRHKNKEGLAMLQQGRITKEWFQRKAGESDLVVDAYNMLTPYQITARWVGFG